MKDKKDKFIKYIKNNKKKSGIICCIAIFFIILLTALIVFLQNSNSTVKKSSTPESKTIKDSKVTESKEQTTDKETITDKETVTEKISETNSENITMEQMTSAEQETTESQSSDINQIVSSKAGSLSVSGTHLEDSSGNIVQLRGLSTHGLSWYPDYINNDFFRQLREDFGVNVIRLAMYTDEYNGYCTGVDKNYFKSLIDNGIYYASQNNMYAIIDWHILSDGNPYKYIDEAKVFFDEMSKKYAGNNNVLYEICNEPNGGTTWSDVKSYAVQIIDVIRKNDEDAVIIVGTPEWCQRIDQAADDPINGYNNIMYALHFYAATHTDELRNRMINAINSGLPVFVSEFGICDASGNGGINEAQANEWVSQMNKYGVSYVMWNISNKNETSAIFNSSCSKNSGFGVEDLSQAGQWFLKLMKGELNLTESSTQQNDSTQNNENNETTAQNVVESTENTVNVQAVTQIINSWTADGKTFYQYDVSVTNNSGNDCTSWYVDITFNENVSLSDSWNGEFGVDGNRIRITSKEYNGTLKNGESMGNVGFIVSGSSNLLVK